MQLKKARGAANLQEPLGEHVHDIRTAMKKVRALNRLVRPAVGQRARRADDRLREIAAFGLVRCATPRSS